MQRPTGIGQWPGAQPDGIRDLRTCSRNRALAASPALAGCLLLTWPHNVFERVVAASHRCQRLWFAQSGSGELLGMVMLSPHSKGGHLDNLAVAPDARGQGVGQALVQRLLADTASSGPAMVSLTTRIPELFEPLGFQPSGYISDGSTAMLVFLQEPVSPSAP